MRNLFDNNKYPKHFAKYGHYQKKSHKNSAIIEKTQECSEERKRK